MTRDAVTSDQLPASGLPFSVAVRGGGLLFLSGQVAQDPATGELADGDIAQQADQILRNIAATLAAIGKPATDPVLDVRGTTKAPGQKAWCVAALQLIGDAQALDLIKHLADDEQPDPARVAEGQKVLDRLRAARR